MNAIAVLPPTTLLNFGKHSDKTYADVSANHPGYCQWILSHCAPNSSRAFRNFAAYLRAGVESAAAPVTSAAAPVTPPRSVAEDERPVTPRTVLRAMTYSARNARPAALASRQPAPDAPLSSMTFAVLDTETTGLSRSDRVVELAVQRIDGNGHPLHQRFDSLINPGPEVNMKPKATQINGITDAMIHAADVPFFNTVHQKLTQLLEGSVIVAHTSHFDERLIRQSCGELPPPAQPWLCSCQLSRRLLPELVSHKLADVCGHYGITINSAHRAGGDVAALASVLPHLLRDAKSRGIETWEQLQQFMQNRRAAQRALTPIAGGGAAAPIAGGGAAAISRPGGSSSSVRGSGNSDSQNNNNGSGGSRNSPLSPPPPFDASAPRGTHPWDSAARKWNGNMNGPWTMDGRPDMRRSANFA